MTIRPTECTCVLFHSRSCLPTRPVAGAPNKVDRLLKVIPEASRERGATVSTPSPEISFSCPPLLAPSYDGGVDRGAEISTLQAQLAALELADAKQRAEYEALKSDTEALKSDRERLLNKVRHPVCKPICSTTMIARVGPLSFIQLSTPAFSYLRSTVNHRQHSST